MRYIFNLNRLILALGASLLTGCSTTTDNPGNNSVMQTSSTRLAQTNANMVKLYYSNSEAPRHYKVIGRVVADNYSRWGSEISQQTIADELRKQAAAIGGTGVIDINTGMAQTMGNVIIR